MFHSLARFGDLRPSTISCWRKTRFSASSRARRANDDRITSSSWVRNANIGPLLYHTTTCASSRIWFLVGTGVRHLSPSPATHQPQPLTPRAAKFFGTQGALQIFGSYRISSRRSLSIERRPLKLSTVLPKKGKRDGSEETRHESNSGAYTSDRGTRVVPSRSVAQRTCEMEVQREWF